MNKFFAVSADIFCAVVRSFRGFYFLFELRSKVQRVICDVCVKLKSREIRLEISGIEWERLGKSRIDSECLDKFYDGE